MFPNFQTPHPKVGGVEEKEWRKQSQSEGRSEAKEKGEEKVKQGEGKKEVEDDIVGGNVGPVCFALLSSEEKL